MKRFATLFLSFFLWTNINAQIDKNSDDLQKNLKNQKVEAKDEGWKMGGLVNIGVNQALLQNWAAGGERASLAFNGQVNAYLGRIKANTMFENTLDLYYGLNYIASNYYIPRKLDDRIDFSSRYGFQPKAWTVSNNKIKNNLYFTGLFRFQSQFTEGYNYELANWKNNPISQFMSPGYFTLALGAEYRPNENFSIFYSPLAAKLTIVNSKYTLAGSAFGVEMGKTSRFEIGSYLTTKYRTNITKNLLYTTRVDLYSNYLAKNKTINGILVKDNPGNIDILWDNFFALKINKFIGVGLGVTLMYDNDQPGQKTVPVKDGNGNVIGYDYNALKWVQLKQVLNLGFTYKL